MDDGVELFIRLLDQVFLDMVVAFDALTHLGCSPFLVVDHQRFLGQVAFCDTVCRDLCRKPAGVHCVVNAATRERVNHPCRIAHEHQVVCNRTFQRPADRDAADNAFYRFTVRELLFHEPVKVILGSVPLTALPAGDADTDICSPFSLGEDPEIPFGCNLVTQVEDRGMRVDVDVRHNVLHRAHDLSHRDCRVNTAPLAKLRLNAIGRDHDIGHDLCRITTVLELCPLEPALMHDRCGGPGLDIDLRPGICCLPDQFPVKDLAVEDVPDFTAGDGGLKRHLKTVGCDNTRTGHLCGDPAWIGCDELSESLLTNSFGTADRSTDRGALFDKTDREPFLCRSPGSKRAGRTATDDEDIVFTFHARPPAHQEDRPWRRYRSSYSSLQQKGMRRSVQAHLRGRLTHSIRNTRRHPGVR